MTPFSTTRVLDRFADRLRQIIHDITVGLDALHRVQFDEPWKRQHRPMYGEW